jgi:hypothetical protein
MNLNKLGYQADINSTSNMSAVVMRLPRYLRSEWAKEAQNSRDRSKEPAFAKLTRFVVKKAKLANTEYGRLISARSNNEKEFGKGPRVGRNVSTYLSLSNKEIKDIPEIFNGMGTRREDQNVYFATEMVTQSKNVLSFKESPMKSERAW